MAQKISSSVAIFKSRRAMRSSNATDEITCQIGTFSALDDQKILHILVYIIHQISDNQSMDKLNTALPVLTLRDGHWFVDDRPITQSEAVSLAKGDCNFSSGAYEAMKTIIGVLFCRARR